MSADNGKGAHLLQASADVRVLPDWATSECDYIPVRYEPLGSKHRLILGRLEDDQHVVCLCERTPDAIAPEALVGMAAAAWEAATRTPCDRDMAEFIAKAWITAYAHAKGLH